MASLYKSVNLKLNLRISVGQQTFLFRWSVEFLAVPPHCNAALPSFIHVKRFSSQRRKAWIQTNRKYDFRASVREQSRDRSRDNIIIHLWSLVQVIVFFWGRGEADLWTRYFYKKLICGRTKLVDFSSEKNNGKSTRNSGSDVFNWMFCYECTRVLFCYSMVFNTLMFF